MIDDTQPTSYASGLDAQSVAESRDNATDRECQLDASISEDQFYFNGVREERLGIHHLSETDDVHGQRYAT